MILRYLRLYYHLLKVNWIHQSQYLWHMVSDVIINILWSVLRLVAYTIIFRNITIIGGWTYETALSLSATFLFVQAISKALFEINFSDFAYNLYRGEFDSFLLKPVSAQFFVSFWKFRPASIIRLLFGICLLIIILKTSGWQFQWDHFGAFIWALGISTILTYSLFFMTVCFSFWLGHIDNINILFSNAYSTTNFPFNIFTTPWNEIVFTILPFAFIATVPAQMFWEANWLLLGWGTLLAGFFFWFSRWVWHQGLKAYTSVSS